MARRKGSLSRKTYWPSSGDILENPDDGVTWEYVRGNVFLTEKGVKIRYGLLVGVTAEFDAPIARTIDDQNKPEWLDGILTIKRKVGGETKPYVYNKETDTWQEEGE